MRTRKNKPLVFILQVLATFMGIAFLLELGARSPWAEKTFQYRSLGNYHYPFDIKWFLLKDYARSNDGVDVLLVGSSLVNTGIDPQVMEAAFHEQTGKHLRIFNFGVEGLNIVSNSFNTSLLVRKYHPALLIYVTEMREYSGTSGVEPQVTFFEDPWVRYQKGELSPLGWLIDHSMALQEFLLYRNWMQASFPNFLDMYGKRIEGTTASGYEADQAIDINAGTSPDPANPTDAANFAEYGSYTIDSARLKDLQEILDLRQNTGTNVLVVEMPVNPSFYDFVGGEAVHREFQQTLSTTIKSNGGYFIPAEACDEIPLDGRSNRIHLNYIGAPVFSACLGQQLAGLSGSLDLLPAVGGVSK